MLRRKGFALGRLLQEEAFKCWGGAVLIYRRCREAWSLAWTPQSRIPLEGEGTSVKR